MCVVRPLTMSWTVSRVLVDSRVTPPPPTLYARGGQVTGRPFGVICDPLLLSGPDPERTDQSVNAGVVWTRRGLCVWIWVWVKWSVSVRVSLCMLTNDSDIWHWKEHRWLDVTHRFGTHLQEVTSTKKIFSQVLCPYYCQKMMTFPSCKTKSSLCHKGLRWPFQSGKLFLNMCALGDWETSLLATSMRQFNVVSSSHIELDYLFPHCRLTFLSCCSV